MTARSECLRRTERRKRRTTTQTTTRDGSPSPTTTHRRPGLYGGPLRTRFIPRKDEATRLQDMRPRTFIVNFKNYPEVMGEGSLQLAKAAAGLNWEVGIDVVVAPPTPMLNTIASAVKIPVFAQRTEL